MTLRKVIRVVVIPKPPPLCVGIGWPGKRDREIVHSSGLISLSDEQFIQYQASHFS